MRAHKGKEYHMKVCQDLLYQYESERDNFWDHIVTGDEM